MQRGLFLSRDRRVSGVRYTLRFNEETENKGSEVSSKWARIRRQDAVFT